MRVYSGARNVTYLEISATSGLGLRLVAVVDESPLGPIEDEPPFLPGSKFGPQLVKIPATRGLVQGEVGAQLDLVPRGLDVLTQVEMLLRAHRQISGQRSLLLKRETLPSLFKKLLIKERSEREREEDRGRVGKGSRNEQ